VRKPNPSVKYQFTNPIVIGNDTFTLNNVNFQEIIKEVRQLPKNKIKEYKKNIKLFIVTATSFMMLPLKSMASELIPTTTNLPKTAEGLPPELLDLLVKLLMISVGSAVMLAAILLVGAAVMKMFRKRKEANEWTVDIIKGLIQVLVAVPVVFLIYYVANLFFGTGIWHVSPF
jgi:hypothetical protein